MVELATTGAETRRQTRTEKPRFEPLPMPPLEYTDAVAAETAHLYERVRNVVPAIEWPHWVLPLD